MLRADSKNLNVRFATKPNFAFQSLGYAISHEIHVRWAGVVKLVDLEGAGQLPVSGPINKFMAR